MIQILLLPFLACVILIGIHTYFGIHVIRRGIIFVDLALAQFAAFGGVIALALGFDHHDIQTYFISLSATLIGALLFSITEDPHNTRQEAHIGIFYAITSAATILILSKSGLEGHHLQHMLVGNLLFTSLSDIILMAIMYSGIALLHLLFFSKFSAASPTKLWHFLFYASFGVVVTSSVKVAGVLLVFAFLIIPPLFAMHFVSRFSRVLLLAWLTGLIIAVLGIIISVLFDLPTGASIVVMFILPVILSHFGKNILQKNKHSHF